MALAIRSSATVAGTGTTATIPVPAGAVSGDKIVAAIVHDTNTQITVGNWGLTGTVGGADDTLRVIDYLGLPSDGPWTVSFLQSGVAASVKYAIVVVAIPPNPSIALAMSPTIDVITTAATLSSTAPAPCPNITPLTDNDLILSIAGWGRGTTFTPPGGVTEAAEIRTGNGATDRTVWVGSAAITGGANVPVTGAAITNDNPFAQNPGNYVIASVALRSTPLPSNWVGDFETGDLSQFTFVQQADPGRIQILSDTPRQGTKYGRFTALDGDVYPLTPTANPRAQVISPRLLFPGYERFISWSTRFPADFPVVVPPPWLVFWQLFGPPYSGPPNLGLYTRNGGPGVPGEKIAMQRNFSYTQDTIWSAPLTRNVWNDFTLRVRLQQDETGFIELWHQGLPQTFSNGLRRLYTKTVEPDQNVGLETFLTNYRMVGAFSSVTIDHDAMFISDVPPAGITLSDQTVGRLVKVDGVPALLA